MQLRGKKINFLGDSITEGAGTDGLAYAFPALLKEELGLAESRNYGIGGTRIAPQQLPNLRDCRLDGDYYTRLSTLDPDADLIFIWGGTNDYGHGNAPFGQVGDASPATFCGAVRCMLEKARARFPQARLVLATPLERLNSDSPYGDGGQPFTVPPLSEYACAMREIAEEQGVPLLDFFAMKTLDPNVPLLRGIYVPDGLHPNNAGHQVLCRIIKDFLEKLPD